MWTSIIRIFTVFRPSWTPWILLALCTGAFVLCAQIQSLRLGAEQALLSAEAAAHNATRAELTQARADIRALSEALGASEQAAAAIQSSLRDALDREAEAAGAAAARRKILVAIRTRPRTETERQEAVDDATRAAVAARINRAL